MSAPELALQSLQALPASTGLEPQPALRLWRRLCSAPRRASGLLPGIGVCALVTAAADVAQHYERMVFGRAWLESLVIAILLGAAVRTFWTPSARWRPGIDFCAKYLLEAAVVLLGASVSAETLASIGPALLGGIVVVVFAAIGASYAVGRGLGLHPRMAMLVACGNSICGNSAIAAVAPVIGADGDDVAASIAFTAVLGVAVVLGLPALAAALHMDSLRFGVLAGLTVYAVPQVLAATAPMGATAVQVGTIVKLVRVLMLGPVCVALALAGAGRRRRRPGAAATRLPLGKLVPWFIVGFLILLAARSAGALPAAVLRPGEQLAGALTVISMAALGLSTDVRTVADAGPRVATSVALSLVGLGLISLGLIAVLHIA